MPVYRRFKRVYAGGSKLSFSRRLLSDGKAESFIEAKQQLENAMGPMAMALVRDQVKIPRDSITHSGLSVNDAKAFIDGVTLMDKDGNED